jgi:benzoyl-CoA reductase/2-hydroxyglutaryl-CoA dehydratase subunit BcrC/BadD/HgdB
MAKAIVVNYTPEQTVEMVSAYVANPSKETVELFAAKFSKSVASIRAKLVKEGVYKKAEYVSKAGETPVDKENLVDQIAVFIPEVSDEANLSSLAKANKKVLKAILKTVSELSAFRETAIKAIAEMDEQFEQSAETLETETE